MRASTLVLGVAALLADVLSGDKDEELHRIQVGVRDGRARH